jgi:hypothetical protein
MVKSVPTRPPLPVYASKQLTNTREADKNYQWKIYLIFGEERVEGEVCESRNYVKESKIGDNDHKRPQTRLFNCRKLGLILFLHF